ncbi:universal stress protein [Corynebacterium sp.]|uniref:universal stress protein n=1 Tax=Corynebacterium sp. TaxID=1720 RepID=UPI0026DB3AEC|nr:universal stress protein [Corynebacterium sp.]MDO5031795.1 universal stress protein [Corynebacterium sp.]
MLSYNVIAVGTDGSPTSLRAVQAAASMARVYDAKLIIMSAFYNHSGSMLGAPNAEDARVPVVSEEMSENFLNNAAEIANKEGAQHIEVIAKSGDPVKALLEIAEDYNADLFVVGNKGLHSVRGRVFGSVATELTRKAHCDVVVVNTTEA